jgi:hypothetical protein
MDEGGAEETWPRLYAKPSNLPVDVIEERHRDIHEWLDKWGAWQRQRYTPETCASMEKLYLRGGRDATPPETAPKPPDPKLVAIDLAWRLMVRRVPQHAEALFLYYVGIAIGRRRVPLEPRAICRRIRIHPKDFSRWMAHSRSMVLNVMRELDG